MLEGGLVLIWELDMNLEGSFESVGVGASTHGFWQRF